VLVVLAAEVVVVHIPQQDQLMLEALLGIQVQLMALLVLLEMVALQQVVVAVVLVAVLLVMVAQAL
jgi:hypothetical protein